MTVQIEAIYEHGVLKPLIPLALEEGTQVEITLTAPGLALSTPYEILSSIAAIPLEVEREERAGREHDQFLYNEADPGEQQ